MTADKQQANDLISTTLEGFAIASVEPWEFGWTFRFSNDATITTQSIWRAITNTGIAITSEDHDQKFGLPEPINAGQRASSTLTGKVVHSELMPITSDLRIKFESASTLELFNTSSGYEGWQFQAFSKGQKAVQIIALGGGDFAIFQTP